MRRFARGWPTCTPLTPFFCVDYNREWCLEKLRYQSPLEARRAFHPTKLLAV